MGPVGGSTAGLTPLVLFGDSLLLLLLPEAEADGRAAAALLKRVCKPAGRIPVPAAELSWLLLSLLSFRGGAGGALGLADEPSPSIAIKPAAASDDDDDDVAGPEGAEGGAGGGALG